MAAARYLRISPRMFTAEDGRVVIGPITDVSARALARLRRILQAVVDEDWTRGRPRVVEIDLTDGPPARPGLLSVLADAREELEAIGGRLMISVRGPHPAS